MALVAILALSPLLAVIGVAVLVASGSPVLFRQTRVGRGGVPFTMLKFRTMRSGKSGPGVTAGGDARITAIGRVLRKTKLDELPELWNVVRGEMSIVGPRPEVPQFVDMSDTRWQRVLAARPGITDPTTVGLIDEEKILAAVQGDHEEFYRRELLPKKLAGYIDYLDRRSWRSDLRVIADTLSAVLSDRSRTA
ncbi:MAG TPA: sugar transferase [Thermoanaerobaculia bacterium]|nr:sugar transferase [Thermoanaerobaculia bacterium]